MNPAALGALTIVLLISTVLVRVRMLRRRGIAAIRFGAIDKTDFLIPPFAFLYFYVVFAGAFGWPTFVHERIFSSSALQWAGVVLCVLGWILQVATLVSFGTSFRVGIDTERPAALVTSGTFAISRNPIYLAFASVLLGEFLIQPSWLLLIYLVGGVALMHRQVLREEVFLRAHYGQVYADYTKRVRRY